MTLKAIEDGIKKLEEIPGDEDVILDQESADQLPEPSSEAATTNLPPEAGQQPAPTKPTVEGKETVNLDELPEFRQFKSKIDQAAAEKAKRIQELEDELARRREAEAQAQQATIAAQINQTADPNARQQLIDQLAAIRSSQYVEGWRKWEQHMAAEIERAGVDPADPRFKRQYSGPEGAAQFQQDLLEAQLEQAQKRAEDAEKKLKSLPSQIDEIVKKRLAEVARSQGFDIADIGEEPQAATSGVDDTEKAIRAFNMGQISFDEFKRRVGG